MNRSTTMKSSSEPGDDPRTQSVDGESSKLDVKRPKKTSKPAPVRNKTRTPDNTEGKDCDRVVDPKTTRSRRRKDSGRIHARRHGILARNILSALGEMGENLRSLRRIEREFRATLRPRAPLGNLLFDRFWSSYLRLALASRLEANLFTDTKKGSASPPSSPSITIGEKPTLIFASRTESPSGENVKVFLPSSLCQQLALVQRYDRHQSREMYRALALLLLMRRGGESALEDWAAEVLGGTSGGGRSNQR